MLFKFLVFRNLLIKNYSVDLHIVQLDYLKRLQVGGLSSQFVLRELFVNILILAFTSFARASPFCLFLVKLCFASLAQFLVVTDPSISQKIYSHLLLIVISLLIFSVLHAQTDFYFQKLTLTH